jgi:hypothetical protein
MILTNRIARTLMGTLGIATPDPSALPTPAATIAEVRVTESSGLARSSRVDGRFWTHNDSGAGAELFALDAGGRALSGPVRIDGARNVDWEDIASDGKGQLWIADLGNNLNKRRDLCVYVVDEPGDEIPDSLPVRRRIRVRFPDQKAFPPEKLNFDCESIFLHAGKLYVITKHRSDRNIRLYRLDDSGGDEEQELTFVAQAENIGQATAADLHRDTRHLAVLTYSGIWLFERAGEGDDFFAGKRKHWRIPHWTLEQCEGLAWLDDETLLISNEGRSLFRVKIDQFEDLPATTAPAPSPTP